METYTYMRWAWQPTQVFLLGESPWAEAADRLQSVGLQSKVVSLSYSPAILGPLPYVFLDKHKAI